jgi:hypothetical protein
LDQVLSPQPGWPVLGPQDQLVCLTVCKRGALEVVRRLAA